MCKKYICNGCSKSGRSGVTHKCQEACTGCISIPPCIISDVRIPCGLCNRTFRSQSCFDKHRTNTVKGKTVCAQKRNCAKCGSLITPMCKLECFKPYFAICQQNREVGHLCSMRPLVKELPRSDNVLFVFYDFETTQDTKISDSTSVHIPDLVCFRQFCARCEMEPDIHLDCVQCGRRRHWF
jgi:hypothetical protein